MHEAVNAPQSPSFLFLVICILVICVFAPRQEETTRKTHPACTPAFLSFYAIHQHTPPPLTSQTVTSHALPGCALLPLSPSPPGSAWAALGRV